MKKWIVLLLLSVCFFSSQAQTHLVELFYNVNNIQHSALCVFDGKIGKCHVLSGTGDCWFDVYHSEYDSYIIYTMSNPSVYGWIPGVCYLSTNGCFIEFQGYRFALGVSVVKDHDWNLKKAQYGFPLDSTGFGSDLSEKPVIVKGASCKHSGCYCSEYHGKQTSTGQYKGKCTNTNGWGHTCGHSPEEHGLNK